MPMRHVWLGLVGFWGLGAGCPGKPSGEPQQVAVPTVRPGIEVLLSDSFHLVRGRRLGLVTNQAGVDSYGVSDIDRLRGSGLNLVALFSPEHGFRGTSDPGAAVASTRDSATGLPIYSLYGRNTAPTDQMLAGIDVMLVDLQDAGARYYTYLFSTVEVMRSAARRGIPVFVLDRPNPLGGAVQGNVLDTAFSSPVGLLAIPMRHGMTLGELALLAQHDLGIGGTLRVIPVSSWKRSMYFDQTGLPFIPPSPNLRSLEALIHYPGTCLFEGTNLSVGRGTDQAFEQVGAPGLDTVSALSHLKEAAPPGVEFRAVAFTPHAPGDGKFADTAVVGIRLRVTDRSTYDPTLTALVLMAAVHADLKDVRHLARLFGGPVESLERLLRSGQAGAAERLAGPPDWSAARARYLERRRPFLLYPE